MLKEIRERHEAGEKYLPAWIFTDKYKAQIHQDRGDLLKLVSTMQDMIDCTCSTCSLKKECNFWSKYEKLESEGGTNENQKG
jgi:hypothetical protein